jgi:hypothetical protein
MAHVSPRGCVSWVRGKAYRAKVNTGTFPGDPGSEKFWTELRPGTPEYAEMARHSRYLATRHLRPTAKTVASGVVRLADPRRSPITSSKPARRHGPVYLR